MQVSDIIPQKLHFKMVIINQAYNLINVENLKTFFKNTLLFYELHRSTYL